MNIEQKGDMGLKTKWNKKKKWLLAGGIVIVGSVAVIFGTVNAKKQNTQSQIVNSVKVEKGTLQSTVEGSGKLEFSNTVDVSIPSEVEIDEVLVESGDNVKKGDTLAKLNKTSVTKALVYVQNQLEEIDEEQSKSGLTTYEKEVLNAQEEELEQQEKELIQLRKNPVIYAEVSGIVASVSDSETSESSATQNDMGTLQTSDGSTNNQGFIYLSCDVTENDTEEEKQEDNLQENTPKTISFEDTNGKLNLEAPVTGKTPQTSVEGEGYTGTVSWNCQGNFEPLTEYTAAIVLNAKDSYQFSDEYTPSVESASYRCNINATGSKMTIEAKFAVTKEDSSKTNEKSQSQASQDSTKSNAGSVTKSGSGSSANVGGGTGTTTSSSDEVGEYGSNETVIVSIAKNDEVQVSIEVDELDILSIEKGQKATVTLDALENQEFTGENERNWDSKGNWCRNEDGIITVSHRSTGGECDRMLTWNCNFGNCFETCEFDWKCVIQYFRRSGFPFHPVFCSHWSGVWNLSCMKSSKNETDRCIEILKNELR